eukprot:m.348745 g.348745  ORF g.348745 m.348745 type:complete len:72 (-) comp20680_c0_seq9:170-385(-)
MEEFFGESHFGNGLSALPNHTVDGNDESIQSLKQVQAAEKLARDVCIFHSQHQHLPTLNECQQQRLASLRY